MDQVDPPLALMAFKEIPGRRLFNSLKCSGASPPIQAVIEAHAAERDAASIG